MGLSPLRFTSHFMGGRKLWESQGICFLLSSGLIDRVLGLPRTRKPVVGLRWRKEAPGSRTLGMRFCGSSGIHSWVRPLVETASGFWRSAQSGISVEYYRTVGAQIHIYLWQIGSQPHRDGTVTCARLYSSPGNRRSHPWSRVAAQA